MRSFQALRGDPSAEYDAVVIGAGVGGLVCANLLARAGLRVLLTEQHYMVGGYCSTFRRKGFTFDAATHFYPLLGNPTTITGALLADLGIPTRWVKMDPVDHFHLPDGTRFSVPADFTTYLERLKAGFPHEVEAIDRFFALVREAYLHGLLYFFRGRHHDRLDPLLPLTVRQVIDQHFQDPRLKLILAADCGHWGSPPCRTSFVFDSMLRLSYFLGNYYPEGGSQRFADDLASAFERRGGHILASTLVSRILVERGAVAGVELDTGFRARRHRVRVRARYVVSNADLIYTVETLLGPAHVPPDVLAGLRALRPTHPCFLVHIGLRDQPLDALRAASGYHWRGWDTDRVAADTFKVFVPTMYEPAMAPPGGQIVILQRLTDIDYADISDWEGHKRQVESDLIARLEAVIPGVAERIVVCTSATARTSSRFTMNFSGAMLGWEMSPDQLGDGRPPIEGLVANLHCVGHWTRPGGGITPVIVSAMDAARAIVGNDVTPERGAARA